MIKVSVIIATYCSGTQLDRAIASLDAQSMPVDEFEVILVDDGSPDDTYDRVQVLEAERPNVRAARIDNSGWPGRPRNVGVAMSAGEYVLFMDHDDEVYPDGLRAAYELGHANGADVVNGKETRTGNNEWGMGVYRGDIANAIGLVRPSPLLPMTPHKLYRRAFLLDHDIAFPETRRHAWEDVYFNVAVTRHAAVISVLGDTPFYHWVHEGDANASADYGDRLDVFWQQLDFWDHLERLMEFIAVQLDGPRHREVREDLLLHQIRIRMLPYFAQGLNNPQRPPLDAVLPLAVGILDKHVAAHLDERLPARDAVRTSLIRQGRADLLSAIEDQPVVGRGRATGMRWRGSVLEIDAEVRWPTPDGSDCGIRLVGDGAMRPLPDAVTAAIEPSIAEMGEELDAACAEFGVRHREDNTVWVLPSESAARREERTSDEAPVTVDIRTGWDVTSPLVQAAGRSVWDFTVRTMLSDTANQQALRAELPGRAALLDGVAAVAYANLSGLLSLDIGQKGRTVLAEATPRWSEARFERAKGRGAVSFTVPLDGVEVSGSTTLRGFVDLTGPDGGDPVRSRVRIVGEDGAATLEGTVDKPSSRAAVTFEFARKTVDPGVWLVPGRWGRVSFEAS